MCNFQAGKIVVVRGNMINDREVFREDLMQHIVQHPQAAEFAYKISSMYRTFD